MHKTGYQYYRRVVGLIIRELSGELTPDELAELTGWLDSDPENKALYDRIRSSENFGQRNLEYGQVDVFGGWGQVDLKIANITRVTRFRQILSYAAALVVLIIVVGGVYFYMMGPKLGENVPEQVATIMPGKARAVLVLNNGTAVSLDSLNRLSFKEKDGTLIEKGKQSLSYSKNSLPTNYPEVYNTIKIPRGGEYSLILSDGTRIYLNAESQLRYPVQFSGSMREVELTGEAYFEVVKDAARPFVVKTNGMNVEVLGTTFNLNAYLNTGKVLTTLVEGSVKINKQGSREAWLLKPDEQAAFDLSKGETEISRVNVGLYTAWKDGYFSFYGDRLEDIMITLTRWYSADVVYTDSSVKDLQFSGSLDRYDNINKFLDIIRSTGKVKIEIRGNTILFSE